ncbi:hypothetical protein [Thermodesulfovibrio hydrogeniphilus]
MEEVLVIRTIEDFERILIEKPEWKERIRKLILTEELLELPSKFEKFKEEDFKPLKQKVDRIEQDVEILKKDVKELKQDVAKLKDDVGDLKGKFLELKVRDNVGAFFGKLLRKAKLVDSADLADSLYEIFEKGLISEADIDEALRVDAVVKGYLRKDKEKKVMVAVEVSNVVDKNDVLRAKKRADIISTAFKVECISAVIGEDFTEGAKQTAEEVGVLLI